MPSPFLRRTTSALAAGAAALALGVAGASATFAAPPEVDLVNLGDSYSAAFGTGGIAPVPGTACLQGDGPDHVSKLDRHPRISLLANAACGGATTTDIAGIVATNPAVQAALAEAELVTLTLGGNDVPWTSLVAACSTLVAGGTQCQAALAAAAPLIAGVGASAGATIATVDAATEGAILVLGYPYLVEPTGVVAPDGTVLMSPENAALLNQATDLLNAAIAQAAEANGATFVDVTDRFAGHGLGSADPWIYLDLATLANPGHPDYANNLHPTTEGYLEGYFPAVQSAISVGQLGR